MRSPSVNGRLVLVALFSTLFLVGSRSSVWLLIWGCFSLYLLRRNPRILFLGVLVCSGCFVSLLIREKLSDDVPEAIVGVVVGQEEGALTIKCGLRRYLVFSDRSADFAVGDTLTLEVQEAVFTKKEIPHAFDYEAYLKANNIHRALVGKNMTATGRTFVLAWIPQTVRQYVEAHFPDPARAYIGLFVLGDAGGLEQELQEASVRLGIRHLFALSGMHLGVITGFLSALVKRLYVSKRVEKTIIVFFLIGYNILTAFQVSLVRASLVMIVFFVTNSKQMRLSRLDCLSLVYLAMLVYNPYYLDSLGFVLTFSMTFALRLGGEVVRHKNRLIGLVGTTLFLNLLLLPLLLEASGGIGILFLPANLIFILFVSVVILPLSFLTLLFPLLADSYMFMILIFESLAVFLEKFNLFLHFNLSSDIAKAMYFIGFLGALCYPKSKKTQVLAPFLIGLALAISFVRLPGSQEVRVYAIGQGDSILVRDGNTMVLIDTGPKDNYDTLVNSLIRDNIFKIDLLVITHWHSDHAGEFEDILKNFDVGTIVAPSVPFEYQGLGILTPKADDCIECGNLLFQVLNAFNDSRNENNNSLVLHTKIGSQWWLFMGDAEQEVERKLQGLDLEVDVVKVGHHGSATASTDAFVDWCDPEYALISVGRNSWGFPDDAVVSCWEEVGEVYLTKESGTIIFTYHPFALMPRISFYKLDHSLLWYDNK
ncbi:MAG: DNA internalization-related competence protein ComEC/Rec2 [Candidatus Izemoplasmatales bacterium]|jgi:competence protein ComEC